MATLFKKLFQNIRDFFFNLWNYKTNRNLDSINKKLERTIKQRHIERKDFLKKFRKYLRKYLRLDASGKYIPLKGKNKAEIYATVMNEYGTRLEELDLKFTKDLQIKE